MSKYVVEFSPPVKIKSKQNDDINSEVNYCLVLAPFQKHTQVEFFNISIKETAVRFLTVVNPLNKYRQFVLPPPNDGLYFDTYEFTLLPNSQREIKITWQPHVHGNIRKLIKIEQVDSNIKYDFVILGNCIPSQNKNLKSISHSKSNNLYLIKKHSNCGQKNIILNKTRVVNCTSEIIHLRNDAKLSILPDSLQSPIRRQTYSVEEKENIPNLKRNIFEQDTILTNSECSFKFANKNSVNTISDNPFNDPNENNTFKSDDSLNDSSKIMVDNNSAFNDFYLTPLKSTENLLSPFSTTKKINDYNLTDDNFVLSPFKPINASTEAKTYSPENKKPTRISVNLCHKFEKTSNNELNKINKTLIKDTINPKLITSPLKVEESLNIGPKQELTDIHKTFCKKISSSNKKSKRPSFSIINSPHYKCSPKTSMMAKTRLKNYSIHSPRTKHLKTPKLDKCDQYLKGLANVELVYHSNAEDPFLKMSQYYEKEWLDRQESDMIRWLNALLMPTEKLSEEEQSDDLEHAAVAWIEASKTSHNYKPMQFAIQKDLFVAQIYRQSPQQWSALRKATSNLITSSNVAIVLSKLTVSIEKDLITVRDDRQIHLDLNLKKKITDLLKCYNPLWLRIGLEAIYGQVVQVKSNSNDLNGLGWFIRTHLFNNDYVKQKFTKINVLQVNFPSYNIAMKKFILKKILMLIYFLDHAKEQKLIRHNPCLFEINSPYKTSYDFLMGFCADMVTAHGDIIRRLRNINYILTHKQTHLDEVNYAVKSLHDLRDGTRITRVVEILFKGDSLSQKLRLPAISKLQKIHNVSLALTRISEHINIEGNISTRDIVNGHREKMLSLFWQIIYKYLTPRYINAATKIQMWWRNNNLNLVILKRIRTKQNLKRHLAAAKIQACIRGYLSRKNWPQQHAELIENREKLHLASTKIKQYLKNKLKLLTEERKRFIILRKTTIFIQRKFRSKIAMNRDQQKYMNIKHSTLLIQKMYRGYIIRKNWSHIKHILITDKVKRITAINIIKHILRKNLPPTKEQLYYTKLKLITLIIQRRFRANVLKKAQHEKFLTLKKSAIVIQRRFKAKQDMINQKKYYLQLKSCTIKLQALIRGYIARKKWPELCSKLRETKIYLSKSSDIIKRALRRNLPLTDDRIKFLLLKKSAIVLQRQFRAMLYMRIQRKQYLHLKTITLKLQSMTRGYILRKHWPTLRNQLQKKRSKLINCSNIIKRCLRKNLPPTNDRIEFIKLKTAAVVLQRKFRAIKAMKHDRKKYIEMKANTIIIQSLIKGYLVRKKWPSLCSELQKNKKRLINCSNIIKRTLRKNLPPTKDYIKYLELRKSVIILQRRLRAMWDMKQKKKQYLLLKTFTIKLQSIVRGNILRKKFNSSLRNELITNRQHLINYSNVIKRVLRKNLPVSDDRLKFLELKRAVIIIQNRFRTNRLVKNYQLLRNNVILIQRMFRANKSMKQQKQMYEYTRSITIKLQAHYRGHLVRKKWTDIKFKLEANKKILIKASNIIKKFLRQCLPPTIERTKYLKLRQSVITMQTRYRATVAMKLVEREYLLLKYCVITLQRYYRAHRAMILQKQQFNYLKKSTIVLQTHIRGYLTRKRWPQLKNSLETYKKHLINALECRRLLASHAFLIELTIEMRAVVQLQNWTKNVMLFREHLQKKNVAASKIQAAFKGYLIRKRFPQIKYELYMQKQAYAAAIIQAFWRGYQVRKKYQCRRVTIRIPQKGALTLGKRHNDVVDVLNRQKRNEYSYRELATVFWNLDTCTTLSKELCVKTTESNIVDYMFHFLQYSNQSQPSIEAREPAIRVFTNLLRYRETSWHIWIRTVNNDIVKDLIKMMKTCCGKISSNKLYCAIATWLWLALQDPVKKNYIKNIPSAIIDLKFMMDTLNKKYKMRKVDKKSMVLPSTLPTWSIGSKCQKCFDSDLYATTQLCKLLNI